LNKNTTNNQTEKTNIKQGMMNVEVKLLKHQALFKSVNSIPTLGERNPLTQTRGCHCEFPFFVNEAIHNKEWQLIL